jgi:hypothetical protein
VRTTGEVCLAQASAMRARIAREVMEVLQGSNMVLAEFINQKSSARYCGYSKQFFNKVCRAGNGPRHVMVGTRWRSRRVWLDEWMERGGPHASTTQEVTADRSAELKAHELQTGAL